MAELKRAWAIARERAWLLRGAGFRLLIALLLMVECSICKKESGRRAWGQPSIRFKA